MPHIMIKMFPGRSEEQKQDLCRSITDDLVRIVKCEEKSVSITIEEISPQEWKDKVYIPDIIGKEGFLYKKPGYKLE